MSLKSDLIPLNILSENVLADFGLGVLPMVDFRTREQEFRLGKMLYEGSLDDRGALNGCGLVEMPGLESSPEEIFGPLRSLSEKIQTPIPHNSQSWLDACARDGKIIASFAVHRHNDIGVAKYPNRWLICLETPSYYTFHDYGSNKTASVNKGTLIAFNETIDHELFMVDYESVLMSSKFTAGSILPVSEMNLFLSLPDPTFAH